MTGYRAQGVGRIRRPPDSEFEGGDAAGTTARAVGQTIRTGLCPLRCSAADSLRFPGILHVPSKLPQIGTFVDFSLDRIAKTLTSTHALTLSPSMPIRNVKSTHPTCPLIETSAVRITTEKTTGPLKCRSDASQPWRRTCEVEQRRWSVISGATQTMSTAGSPTLPCISSSPPK